MLSLMSRRHDEAFNAHVAINAKGRTNTRLRINPMIAGYVGKRRQKKNPVPPHAQLVRVGYHEVNPGNNTYQDAENNDPHTRL